MGNNTHLFSVYRLSSKERAEDCYAQNENAMVFMPFDARRIGLRRGYGTARFRRNNKSNGRAQRGPDFVSLVKKLQPTVVNVSVSTVPPVLQPGAQGQDDSADDLMEKFFGVPPPAALTPQRQQGSGFIIGSDGIIIVTNAHVVENAKKSSLN